MTEKALTVDEAITRLSFVRFQLNEKQFPGIRRMMANFKGIRFPAFVSPIRTVLDGVSYDFKAKSPEWSYELHTSNPDEDFPLAVWAESCSKEIWEFLRTNGEFGFPAHPITAVDKECIGPVILRSDAGSGDLEEVDRLIRLGVNVNAADFWNHETALQAAVLNHQLPMVKKLLSAGANSRNRDDSGQSLFHFLPDLMANTARKMGREFPEAWRATLKRAEDRIKIAEALKSNGADPETADDQGETPLMAAVSAGDVELTRWFIRQGSDPAKKDKNGNSAHDRALKAQDAALLALTGEMK